MTEQELINSLGIGAETETNASPEVQEGTVAPEGEVADGPEAATKPAAKRTEIKIVGTIAKASGLLPARAPSGGGFGRTGSKYPFETLEAPTVGADGVVTAYDYFEVKLTDVENADAKKLQSAIQAATAAQNKINKAENTNVYYVSRTVLDEQGAYIGSAVYRVDATLDEDDTPTAE